MKIYVAPKPGHWVFSESELSLHQTLGREPITKISSLTAGYSFAVYAKVAAPDILPL